MTGSKCNWDNEQERCMGNTGGDNHHWKTEEMAGRITDRSIAGEKLRCWGEK